MPEETRELTTASPNIANVPLGRPAYTGTQCAHLDHWRSRGAQMRSQLGVSENSQALSRVS